MSRITSIVQGKHFDEFIKSEMESGRYSSVTEIIKAGLSLLEKEGMKIDLINEALVIGEESGKAVPFNNEAFKKEMHARLSQH